MLLFMYQNLDFGVLLSHVKGKNVSLFLLCKIWVKNAL